MARETAAEFLDSLPSRQRAVLVLRYYEGLTDDAVGAALGISLGSVRAQAQRGLDAWRDRLAAVPALGRPEVFAREGSRPAHRDPAEVLTEGLGGLAGAGPTPLPDHPAIRARAQERRRTRRLTALAAVAALTLAAAVVSLTRVDLTGGPSPPRYDGPTAAPSRGPTAPPSSGPALPPPVERRFRVLGSFEPGLPPAIGFTAGSTYVAPDGTRTPLKLPPGVRIGAVAAYDGGFLVADDPGRDLSHRLYRLRADGSPVWTRCTSGVPATAPDGAVAFVSWVEPCAAPVLPTWVTVLRNGRESTVPYSGVFAVVGILGDQVVLMPAAAPATSFLGNGEGGLAPIPTLSSVAGVSEAAGLFAGQGAGGERFIGRITDSVSGNPVAELVGWTLGRFSPQGSHLLAWRLQLGQQPLGVFGIATGHQVLELTGGVGTQNPHEAAWEDNGHVLVVVSDRRGKEAIVRAGLDGKLTLATPVAGAGTYHLAVRP
jgi:hypothetical protein